MKKTSTVCPKRHAKLLHKQLANARKKVGYSRSTIRHIHLS